MYSDVFTVSVSFIFCTECWTTSFANYQENEAWVKIEAIKLVSINNAFVNRITVVYLRCVFLLGTNIIWCLSANKTFRSSFWTKAVFLHTSPFLFRNPVIYCEANIKLMNLMKLWCFEKVTPFIATPRRPPYWIIHCCYQIMSRERKLVQWLVNSLFWSRLSKLMGEERLQDAAIFPKNGGRPYMLERAWAAE